MIADKKAAVDPPPVPSNPGGGVPGTTDSGVKPTTPVKVEEPPAPTPPNYRQQFADLEKRAREQLNLQNYDESTKIANQAVAVAVSGNLPELRTTGENLVREIERSRFVRRADDALKARDAAQSKQAIDALVARFPEYAVAPLRARLNALERDLRAASLYKDAMRAFFVGNHARALQTIAQIEAAGPLTARGHFYRACSLAAQAAATPNPRDDRRLNDALRSYKQAAAARSQFEQDLRYISPKIQSLLGITRQ
jgi:hypothetical protein